MPEAACKKFPCRKPSTAGPLPRAIGVRSYFSYISLWQFIHIASGSEESVVACSCGSEPAKALIDESGKAQRTKKISATIKKTGEARPISRSKLQGTIRVPDN